MNELTESSSSITSEPLFFAALPLCGRAANLHRHFRVEVVASFARLLGQLERTLRLEPDSFVSLINDLDVARPFSPKLYSVHWLLIQGLQTRNIEASIKAITLLRCLGENAYAQKGQLIETLDNGLVEDAIREYLEGSEGPRDELGGLPEIFAISQEDLESQRAVVLAAIDTIHRLDQALAEEFDEYVSEIRLFRGKTVRGITSVRVFGSIHLRLPESELSEHEKLIYYVDHFTHETSHLHLHSLMTYDPLILNDDSQKFTAPIRPDLRPLFGIFHAAFVLSRIIRVLGLWHNDSRDETVLENLRLALSRFESGMAVLKQHATLTTAGEDMLKNMNSSVGRWKLFQN